ncbi:hypothetical protein CNECB9_2200003 [Cupriavidus necator]|uniref:Uncharacterized protein n=1 Tax=Cupriavidus necator TaxID=106590 RepID=A0A1K0ICL4_CUPNE|nr:hypothetical protein CNECB9_2200003 [Cupriavidus necator]
MHYCMSHIHMDTGRIPGQAKSFIVHPSVPDHYRLTGNAKLHCFGARVSIIC